MVTEPDIDVTLTFVAECPCGDRSYPLEITGGTYVGVLENSNIGYEGAEVDSDGIMVLKTKKV